MDLCSFVSLPRIVPIDRYQRRDNEILLQKKTMKRTKRTLPYLSWQLDSTLIVHLDQDFSMQLKFVWKYQ